MTRHQLHELFLRDHPKPIAPVVGTESPRPTPSVAALPAVQPAPPHSGLYSCIDLEHLWKSQGGNPNDAFVAAEIATAESGGNPAAISPTWDFGLWQINGSHNPSDPQIYLNPVVNVRAAIAISDNGRNWDQWTTYTEGLYIGRC